MSYPRKQLKLHKNNYLEWEKQHQHLETICHLCFQRVPPLEAKTHACPLKTYCPSDSYRRLACFDFETSCEPKSPEACHEAIFLSCYFETVALGEFKCVSFANDEMEFVHDGVLSKENGDFQYDYYPPNVAVHIPPSCEYRPEQSFKSIKEANAHLDQVLLNNPSKRQLSNVNTSYEYNPSQEDDFTSCFYQFEAKTSWGKNAARKFLLFILRPRFINYVFVSHNGGRFDMKFLWEELKKLKIEVEMSWRDLGYIHMYIRRAFNILFLDSRLYFCSSLSNICVRFGLKDLSKPFFLMEL